MRSWIANRPVAAFFILAILFSWTCWFSLISRGLQVGRGSEASHFPGLLGPLLAAFAMSAVRDGRAGPLNLFRRMFQPGLRWPANLLLGLSPLLFGLIAFAALAFMGQELPEAAGFTAYPGLPAGLSLPMVCLLVFLVSGYGEEVGWRGFALDPLLAKYGEFRGTLVLAGLWLVWHLPVFWLNETMAALLGPMVLGWIFGLFAGAFVLTHVYLLSGSSILIVALWHASYNMLVAPAAGEGIPAAIISSLVSVWGIIVAVLWWKQSQGLIRRKTAS